MILALVEGGEVTSRMDASEPGRLECAIDDSAKLCSLPRKQEASSFELFNVSRVEFLPTFRAARLYKPSQDISAIQAGRERVIGHTCNLGL